MDKTGATIDLQAATLDWLITDARQGLHFQEPAELQALTQSIGSDR